jgi:hypothetical protein
MKFFNVDLHISVIEDIKYILEGLGHSVTNWSISGHTWVFNRQPARVDVINASNWESITPEMCDQFYARYRTELSGYDAFIVTHTPSFAMLFEKFCKPIVIVASTRYEAPFTDKPALWEVLNEFIRKNVQSGRVIPIANNKYDAAYAHYFTGVEWLHIPSLCAYTKSQYLPQKREFLFSSRLEHGAMPAMGGMVGKHAVLCPGYKWPELAAYRGIVHIPHNVSTMTIFENYTSNIPMFFPTQKCMRELRLAHPGHVLCEMSWAQVRGLAPRSPVRSDVDDPNNYRDIEVFARWLTMADFYDSRWMPHLTYFDSYDELAVQLGRVDTAAVSQRMRETNCWRQGEIHRLWTDVIKQLR